MSFSPHTVQFKIVSDICNKGVCFSDCFLTVFQTINVYVCNGMFSFICAVVAGVLVVVFNGSSKLERNKHYYCELCDKVVHYTHWHNPSSQHQPNNSHFSKTPLSFLFDFPIFFSFLFFFFLLLCVLPAIRSQHDDGCNTCLLLVFFLPFPFCCHLYDNNVTSVWVFFICSVFFLFFLSPETFTGLGCVCILYEF